MSSAFIQTSKGIYLSYEAVAALCPSCAKSMKSHNVRGIRLNNIKAEMLNEIKQNLGTGDPGFFGRCMGHDFGHSFNDKESFCAWLHHRVTGHWPGED
jgi:hypothetical protein